MKINCLKKYMSDRMMQAFFANIRFIRGTINDYSKKVGQIKIKSFGGINKIFETIFPFYNRLITVYATKSN